MHITNLFHFLNEQGDIPDDMRPQAKKMAGFLVMVVDAATAMQSEDFEDTGLRCHKRGCHGHIMAVVDQEESFIYWGCTDCNNEGRIDGWRGSRWDASG